MHKNPPKISESFLMKVWYSKNVFHKKERMKMEHNKRSSFSGKLGYVLSAAGASVGLGNIWRFPYLAAKYGGGISC